MRSGALCVLVEFIEEKMPYHLKVARRIASGALDRAPYTFHPLSHVRRFKQQAMESFLAYLASV
jgi:hypothetical protein